MNYTEEYKSKLTTAEKAVSVIKSGDWVDYGWCTNTPVATDAALAKRMPELHDVNIHGGVLMHEPAIFQIEHPEEHFTWNSWHMNGIELKAVSRGFSFYAPIKYSELPRYYRDRLAFHLNVLMIQAAPMDSHGYFNFGPSEIGRAHV